MHKKSKLSLRILKPVPTKKIHKSIKHENMVSLVKFQTLTLDNLLWLTLTIYPLGMYLIPLIDTSNKKRSDLCNKFISFDTCKQKSFDANKQI